MSGFGACRQRGDHIAHRLAHARPARALGIEHRDATDDQVTFDAAAAIARKTAVDDCAGPPEPGELARASRDLDLYHPWNLGTEEAIRQDVQAAVLLANLESVLREPAQAALASSPAAWARPMAPVVSLANSSRRGLRVCMAAS